MAKKRRIIVWASVSTALVALFLTATILGHTAMYDLFNIVLPGGGPRARYKEGVEPIYLTDATSKEDALKKGNEVNEEVCEEGFILLKNDNGALPLATPKSSVNPVSTKPKISVFGKNSVNPAYGGSGSGTVDDTQAVSIYSALEEAGYETNPILKSFYENAAQSGPARSANSNDLDSGKTVSVSTAETPIANYNDQVRGSYASYSDMALIVITRIGGEGFDLPRSMAGATGAREEADTYLQLDANEAALLKEVCGAGFKKVVIVLNSAAPLELTFLKDPSYYAYQPNIDAALWIGFPGVSGMTALGRILNGSVNPSGRTPDTYATHLKDAPSFQNFGDNNSVDGDKYTLAGKQSYYFVDYEESVYVGYRYYETRGFTDGEQWYNDNVVYPFGYGLSYTDFSWEILDDSSIRGKDVQKDGNYSVNVRVRNTGSRAGKDVVELYGSAPYTAGGIEKSHVILLDFAKTPLLKPGESATVTLTFDPYGLASYDEKDANGNGFKGYELDGGEYRLYVAKNAHDRSMDIPFGVAASGIRYDKDPVTGKTVENRYTDCEDPNFNSDTHLQSRLSRSDWEGTFPKAPTLADRTIDPLFIYAVEDMTPNNPNAEALDELDMPDFDMDNGLQLKDFILRDEEGHYYVDYNDKRWNTLLDQCSLEELINLYDHAPFTTQPVESIGKPRTNDTDGPAGFINFMNTSTFYGACSYCAEVVMAATYNQELIERLGKAVGDEGIWGNAHGDKIPYSGWYAPAVNIHRSPFGGRNFEYFSEDGVLNGKMAAAEIRGCQSKGVYCYVKHFALNEQETHRALGGDMSWATEQSIREIYLKPFEIAVKEGKTRAMMSSFNRIGTRWTGGDYRLLTEILREEWGFQGMVLCDFNTHPEYMDSRQMAYAGGDLNLATFPKTWVDESSVADLMILRQCAKNCFYTVAYSNAFNGEIIGYDAPYWTTALTIVDCVIGAAIVIWGACVLFIKDKKKELPS